MSEPPAATPPDEEVADQHRLRLVERVRLLEANLPSVFFGTFVCIAAIALLDRQLARPVLVVWVAAQLVLTAWRMWTLRPREARLISLENVDERLRRSVLHASLSGSLWGTFGFMSISPADPVASLFTITMLTSLVGGATALVAHLPRVYITYSFLIITPAALRVQLQPSGLDGEFRWVGLLLILFLLFSWIASRLIARSVNQSIDLRLQNAALVDGLQQARLNAEAQSLEITEALSREREANLSKSRFLAAASHDLRQPLHSLRLHTSTLESRARGTAFERNAAMMGRSVSALDNLFSSILDLSTLDAGTLEPGVVPVSLETLLKRLAVDFAPLAAERALAIEIDTPDVWVRTDPVLLERLLRNLLSNAIRYTRDGGVRITTKLDGASALHLSVQDTGIGIAPDQLDRVFDEFVQLDQEGRDRSEGIGLGLSIVRRIVRLLELDLSLTSSSAGTTATLALPLASDAERRASVRSSLVTTPRPDGLPDEATVLVVDDEAVVRDAMEDFLEDAGMTVIACWCGDEALTVLEETGAVPDAIVCDYRLKHGERGTGTIERLRAALGRPVPALLMTGETGASDLAERGSRDYPVLRKPCDPAELHSALARLLRSADQR